MRKSFGPPNSLGSEKFGRRVSPKIEREGSNGLSPFVGPPGYVSNCTVGWVARNLPVEACGPVHKSPCSVPQQVSYCAESLSPSHSESCRCRKVGFPPNNGADRLVYFPTTGRRPPRALDT